MPKEKSIITDKALREKLALQVMDMMNKAIEIYFPIAKKQNKDPNKKFDVIPYYTKEEVKKWINNSQTIEVYQKVEQNEGKTNIIKKQEAMGKLKINESYEEVTEKNTSGDRFGYAFLKNPNTTGNKLDNQYIKNASSTQKGKLYLAYKGMDVLDNADPLIYTETSEEELIDGMIKDNLEKDLGFLNIDISNSMDSNTLEFEQLGNITELVQSNTDTFFVQKYKNPLSLLLPPNPFGLELLVDNNKELLKNINSITQDVKEFKEGKGLSTLEFIEYCNGETALNLSLKKNVTIKEMVNNGIFTKGMISQYKFVDKDGKSVKYADVVNNYKDGKLQNGIQRVALTEKEKKEIEMNKRIASFMALKEKTDLDYDRIQKGRREPYENSIFTGILQKFTAFTSELDLNKLSKEELNQYIIDNSGMIKIVEDEYFKLTDKTNDIDSYKKIYDDLDKKLNSVTKETGNYKHFAKLAKDLKTKNMENGKNKSSSYQFFKKRVVVDESLLEKPIVPLSENQVIENLAIIKQLNEKENEYLHRGKIGRWWYKNSHNAMKEAKKDLIDQLSVCGFDKNTLENFGNKHNEKYGEFIYTSMEEMDCKCKSNLKIFDNHYYSNYNKKDVAARQNVINNQIEALNNDINQVEKVEELKNDLEDFNKNKDIPENEFNKKVKEDTNELNKGSVKEAVDKNNDPEQIIEDIVEDNGKSV